MATNNDDLMRAAYQLGRHLEEYGRQLQDRADRNMPDFIIEQTITLTLDRLTAWWRIKSFDSEDAREALGLGPTPEMTAEEWATLGTDTKFEETSIHLSDRCFKLLETYKAMVEEHGAYSNEVSKFLNANISVDNGTFFRIARDARAMFQALERHEPI